MAQARCLLTAIDNGGTRSDAAWLGNITLQIVRDWVIHFDAQGPKGLIDRKAAGRTPLLTNAHRQALAAQIESGPIPATHAWRAGGCATSANGCGRSSGSRRRH